MRDNCPRLTTHRKEPARCDRAFSPPLFKSKSFRGAPEGSTLLHQHTVRSLIQNHRPLTAARPARSPAAALPPLNACSHTLRGKHRVRIWAPLTVSCLLFDSMSAVSVRRCHRYGPPTRVCAPPAAEPPAPPRRRSAPITARRRREAPVAANQTGAGP